MKRGMGLGLADKGIAPAVRTHVMTVLATVFQLQPLLCYVCVQQMGLSPGGALDLLDSRGLGLSVLGAAGAAAGAGAASAPPGGGGVTVDGLSSSNLALSVKAGT